jgi:ATP-dependent protease HslVU (ClpYQ) peptidase subunit
MTTVAYDGKYIAADKMGNDNGLAVVTKKLHQLEDGRILAFAGSFNAALMVIDYLNGYGAEPSPEDLEEFNAIIIDYDGTAKLMQCSLQTIEIYNPHAIGSGRDFALAGMALGLSPVDAVKLAMDFDINTGIGVEAYEIMQDDTYDTELDEMKPTNCIAQYLGRIGLWKKQDKYVPMCQFVARKLTDEEMNLMAEESADD